MLLYEKLNPLLQQKSNGDCELADVPPSQYLDACGDALEMASSIRMKSICEFVMMFIFCLNQNQAKII
jgi:hypothetical protein